MDDHGKKQPSDDETEIDRILNEELTCRHTQGYIFLGDDKTCMPAAYLKIQKDIQNFEVHDSDIFVISFPKSGTTWTQEMVWMIGNDMDFEGAQVAINERCPFLELSCMYDVELLQQQSQEQCHASVVNSVEFTKNAKHPRYIKTHLPISLLPDDIRLGHKTPKIIYVMRNPKDACVSFHHHNELLMNFTANLENYCKVFMAGKVIYGPFWKNVLEFWRRKDMPNILIIAYEDMKRDLPSVIRKVAAFLNKTLTDEQIKQLCAHLSFDSMKKNPAVNLETYVDYIHRNNVGKTKGNFLRAGVVGKYKEELLPETIKRFESWIKQNTDGTGFLDEYPFMK